MTSTALEQLNSQGSVTIMSVLNTGGTPVFTGTRVPICILMKYLEAGDSLDGFLYQL